MATNTILNPSIIAKAAVRILDNELVMARQVYRAYENEFEKRINGYSVGDTISIRKPAQFAVRTGAVANQPSGGQDVLEGKLTFQINKQNGVDFAFSSADLTLRIEELSDRVIRPAMVRLANQVDQDLMALYKDVYNWVGTPGQIINSFPDFQLAPERLDNTAVPQNDRSAVFSPSDFWAIAGSQTALFMQQIGTQAYRRGEIGMMGGVDTYMAQNVPVHTTGTATNGTVNGAGQNVTYNSVMNTESVPGIQNLITAGNGAAGTWKKGDVFTIAGVFAVNPVTKATLAFLQQFVVQADVTADGAGAATLSIAPAIIISGAFQSVSAAPAGGAAITKVGASNTGFVQNMVFQENAFALCMVPMVRPPGAVDVARETYKGISVRLIPFYDGVNDLSQYRLDVLYGVKTIDPRLATRLSGSP